jgi:hypothetical protein
LVTLHVEGVAVVRIPLTAPNGSALAPGRYAIEAEGAGSGPTALVELTVERLPVDTVPHQAPVPDFRPETRKGSPSLRTVGEGVGLGVLALLVSTAVNDARVSGRTITRGAWLVGGSVTLANIALKRPGVPIAENIAYNQALARQRTEEDRAAAAENARRFETAPLRIRTTRQP